MLVMTKKMEIHVVKCVKCSVARQSNILSCVFVAEVDSLQQGIHSGPALNMYVIIIWCLVPQFTCMRSCSCHILFSFSKTLFY
jgi:hypothetical protein